MEMTRSEFGVAPGGEVVERFACTNRNGVRLELISLGATIKAVHAPDRTGHSVDITLGFPGLEGYLGRHPYFGVTIGRFANRIAGASFSLDGVTHRLAANNGPHHLHGGDVGLSRVVWEAEPFAEADAAGVRFRYLSPDGEDRYPGNLTVEAAYSLKETNELTMSFAAAADRPTPVNLANHTYWNLAGGGDILDHVVRIDADRFLPVDAGQIPTGEIARVAGTPMDFTTAKPVRRDFDDVPGNQVGYDHCFVLRHRSGPAPAARVHDPGSGRIMEVITSQPGVQFYSGNNLSGFEPHGGFGRYSGLCLETQHFPDSPNRSEFPSTILGPGERYAQVTVHRFSND